MSVGQETPEPQAAAPAQDERQQLLDALAREEARMADLRGMATRMQADLDILRKRAEIERRESRVQGFTPILRRVLPVLDDIERAFTRITPPFDRLTWTDSVDFIYMRLQSLLREAGVQPIEAVGQRFDPALHEAISFGEPDTTEAAASETATVYEDIVAEQLVRGYTIEGRVLRSSIVRVERRPAAGP